MKRLCNQFLRRVYRNDEIGVTGYGKRFKPLIKLGIMYLYIICKSDIDDLNCGEINDLMMKNKTWKMIKPAVYSSQLIKAFGVYKFKLCFEFRMPGNDKVYALQLILDHLGRVDWKIYDNMVGGSSYAEAGHIEYK